MRIKKETTKHLGKRALALFLSLVMSISMLQLTAFAAGQELPAVEIVHQGESSTITGDDGVTSITGSKTIEKVSGSDDTFDITLNVTTVSTSETSTVTKPADVVLVMDVTLSMDDTYNDGQSRTKKWSAMKSAANNLIDSLLPEGNTNNRVAIVTYAGDGYKLLSDWQTDANSAKKYYTNTKNSGDLRKDIDGSYWGEANAHGTNCQAGFLGADVQLNTARAEALQYVIYMTDGYANEYYEDSEQWTLICPYQWHWHGSHCYRFDGFSALPETAPAIADIDGSGSDDGDPNANQVAILQAQALKANHTSAKLIAVGIGTNTENAVINSNSNTALDASYTTGTLSISAVFEDISQDITNEVAANGTVVTDPMSAYVDLKEIRSSIQDGEVEDENNTISWNLGKAQPKSQSTVDQNGKQVTTTVYQLTYRVTVKRDIGFYTAVHESTLEDKGVPTNGETSMPYTLGTKSGTLIFDVPRVTSEMPVVPYTVSYLYKEKNSDNYILDEDLTITGKAELFSTITIDSDDYSKGNYTFREGPVGDQTLSNLEANNFELKYDPIPVTVTVNHYLVEVEKTDGGPVYSVPKLQSRDTYPNPDEDLPQYYKGDKFTNTKYLESPAVLVKKIEQAEDGKTYTSDADKNVTLSDNTTIELYYTVNGEDKRTPADVTVNYFYRTNTWQKNADNKFELVGEYGEPSKTVTETRHLDKPGYAVTPQGGDGYKLDKIEFNGVDTNGSYNVTLVGGKNTVNVYYEKNADEPETADLTITHIFKEQTINGLSKGTSETEYDSTKDGKVHVGEIWKASDRSGDGYVRKTADADMKKVIESGSNTITVEYVKDCRVKANIEVNHIYTTYKEVIDQTTGDATLVEVSTDSISDKPEELGDWYVGQEFEPTPKFNCYESWDDEHDSDTEKRTLTDGKNVFNLYYATVTDRLGSADVTVFHHYVTYKSYVNDEGKVIEKEKVDDKKESGGKHEGKVGEFFTAELEEKEIGGKQFKFSKADTDGRKVTLKGPNGEYHIYYEYVDNQLGDKIPVTVQPIYKTYYKDINPITGEEYKDLSFRDDSTQAIDLGKYYAGQNISALTADYAKEGFQFDPDDTENTKDATIKVSADNTVITIVYSHVDDGRTPVKVKVRNHYETLTKEIVDGVYKETTSHADDKDYTEVAGTYYKWQKFSTEGKGTQLPGYELDTRTDVVQPEANITLKNDVTYVDFYWYQEDNRTEVATVEVIHHYTINDKHPGVKDITWDEGVNLNELGNRYYVGQKFAVSPDFKNGIFSETNITDVEPEGAIGENGIVLQEDNVIEIWYVKTNDSRASTSVTVNHKYYHDDAALAEDKPEATYVEQPAIKETESFTATPRTENQGLFYAVNSADPENYTITVSKDAAENVITINYIRADGHYTVVHEYYTGSSFDGSTSAEAGAKLGDVVRAADIAKVTTYNGNSYSYTGATPESITVSDDGSSAITLRYSRTGYVPPYTPGPGSDPDPDPDSDPDPDPLPPVVIPDVEPPLAEIPEEDVPLTDVPEDEVPLEELPDEDVPLAEIPETGDAMALYTALSILSGMGLAGLGLTSRKRKEEDAE